MHRLLSTAVLLALPALAPAQEPVDHDVISRIRMEAFHRSQVMETAWNLTDRYGPRLTNSPEERAAMAYAVERLTEFGLADARLEAWGEFGLGWSFQRCLVQMDAPTCMPLIALPQAWTSGTDGEVTGTPILMQVETEADLEQYRGQLAGRIVLQGAVGDVDSPWEAQSHRYTAEELADLERAPLPQKDAGGGGGRPDFRAQFALRRLVGDLLREEGAAVVLRPDGGRYNDYGVITLGGGGSRDPAEPRAPAQVVVSTEQWNRIARLVQRGHEVTMTVDVRTTFHDEDLQGYNVLAELPGKDPLLKDEVVMLGAHFDSWHPATGATDNGGSSAVVMEAARILKAIGANNRRTIRVGLWSGEEQGLLGSRGYVTQHFADRNTMELKPEHSRLAAYFNLDNGCGMIRGIYLQENAACRPIFAAWLAPFEDLGATAVTIRNTGGTDHQSFHGVGLPGFQFIQDPMDYDTRTHHTNMDFLERIHEGDVQQAAAILASFAYHASVRDEKLPRPPLPEPRGAGSGSGR